MQTGTETLATKLNKQLETAREAYYAGSPIMSDSEFDALEAQLSALVQKYPTLNSIATALTTVGDSKSTSPRITHARPMLSIENYFTEDSFVTATKNYGAILLAEPKRDGISCELKYEKGILVQAVTRGDGTAGEDMTAQVKACAAIPQNLKNYIAELPTNINIRGELVMSNTELARINALGVKQYANTRNLVAGTMKQKDLKTVASRKIELICWDVYSANQDALLPDSSFDRMKLVESFGFPKYEGIRISNTATKISESLTTLLATLKNSDITADGVVIKADSHAVRNKLGVGDKYTKFQHCFKPQNLSAETKLLDVIFGIGRTGKITPVAILEPVNLGGAMVSRANCCNETWMENLGLKLGATISILRSGDVIPYITGMVSDKGAKPITFPSQCPACGSKLQMDMSADIVQRFCENSLCSGKAAEQFAYVGHRDTLEIDNLGGSMAAELVENGIQDLADLFAFGNSITADNKQLNKYTFRSKVNTMKMVKSLETAKTATWDRWFAALNIPMIGHSLGRDISKALKLTENDLANLPKLLLTLPSLNIEKLGTVKTAAIIDWAKNPANEKFCTLLHNASVRPQPLATTKAIVGGSLNGIAFCITGELVGIGTRKEVEAKLTALGAEALSDVRSNCNLVIVGEAPGSKLAKAQKKGIKIVDTSWVRSALGI